MVNPKTLIKDFLLLKFLDILGITDLNAIQAEAIRQGLLFHQNFLVCTPSGSGKTLIGLLGIANGVFQGQKCVYLVPYKALAAEKQQQFQAVFHEMGVILKQPLQVRVLTGDSEAELADVADFDVLITTYEKCDSLMRQPDHMLGAVKTIVADEIHEISADNRGGRIEMLISRILTNLDFIQLIALSATIENIDDFRLWLSSFSREFKLIFSTHRPVPLEYSLIVAKNKLGEIKKLVVEAVAKHGQVLIFVNRRADCEEYAQLLKNVVKKYMPVEDVNKCLKEKRKLIAFKSVAEALKETLEYGVAYHNASLSAIERQIVESLYRERAVKVLIATTTLAAGINTPARLVIIENIVQVGKYINLEDKDFHQSSYHLALGTQGVFRPHSPNLLFQMLGRAGRPGYDTVGRGVILLKNAQEYQFARHFYFCQTPDAAQNLIPKYADLSSRINDPAILAEIVLVKINEAGEISLDALRAYLEQSLFFFLVKKKLGPAIDGLLPEQEIMKYLFIDHMDLGYFLRVHGSTVLTEYVHEVTEVAPGLLKGHVKTRQVYYHYRFEVHDGISCSCRPTKVYKAASVNDNFFFEPLCPHLTTALTDFSRGDKADYRGTVEFLLPIIFKHDYVIAKLIANGMIVQLPHTSSYKITPFGKLTLTLYLLPGEMMWVHRKLTLFAFQDPAKYLDVVVDFHSTHSKRDKKKLDQFATAWINEYSIESILQDLPAFGVGDLFAIKNELTRIASIFDAVARFMGKPDIAGRFLTLSLRLKHGILPNLIELAEQFPNLSRNKARILYDCGYPTKLALESADPLEVYRKTKIPLAKIKEILGRYEKPKSTALSLLSFISQNSTPPQGQPQQ